jgi:hypothetical protein
MMSFGREISRMASSSRLFFFLQAEFGQEIVGPIEGVGKSKTPEVGEPGHAQVFDHGKLGVNPHGLVGPDESRLSDGVGFLPRNLLSNQGDLSAVQGEVPRNGVDEGRLAAAVGADHSERFTRSLVDVQVLQGPNAAKTLVQSPGI